MEMLKPSTRFLMTKVLIALGRTTSGFNPYVRKAPVRKAAVRATTRLRKNNAPATATTGGRTLYQ